MRVLPVSASSSASRPAAGRRSSSGLTIRRAMASCRLAALRHRPIGSSEPKSLRTTIMARRADRRTRRADAELGLERGCRRGDQGPNDLGQVADAAGRLELDLDPIADHEQAHPVAVVGGRRGQERRGLRGPIGLGPSLGPEPHASRDIQHQPESQRPLLDEPPYERFSLPGRDVPVQMPHIVSRLVGRSSANVSPTPGRAP